MTTTNKVLQMDGKEFKRNQLDKLVTSIEIADDIAAGTFEITDLSDAERAQLADQLAQASGILGLCAVIANDQRKSNLVIEMYSEFRKIYAEYAFQAATISGAFADKDEIASHLTGVESLVAEHCNHYEVDPVALHKTAMDIVGDKIDEPKETPEKKCCK